MQYGECGGIRRADQDQGVGRRLHPANYRKPKPRLAAWNLDAKSAERLFHEPEGSH